MRPDVFRSEQVTLRLMAGGSMKLQRWLWFIFLFSLASHLNSSLNEKPLDINQVTGNLSRVRVQFMSTHFYAVFASVENILVNEYMRAIKGVISQFLKLNWTLTTQLTLIILSRWVNCIMVDVKSLTPYGSMCPLKLVLLCLSKQIIE